MSSFVHVGEFDGVSVSYTEAAPRPKAEPVPEPEIPPHVMANLELNYELECELNNRGREYRNSRPRGNSTIAHKRFHGHYFKSKEQVRSEYFEELHEAIKGIEAREPKPVEREKTYEDVIRSWGGRFSGESQVEPGRGGTVLQQT